MVKVSVWNNLCIHASWTPQYVSERFFFSRLLEGVIGGPLYLRMLGKGVLLKTTTLLRVSQKGSTGVGGQFGQNGRKLHENDKIGILGSKQWVNMGGQANFLGRF